MANGYPCPNPTCSHRFPEPAVKGAPALKCPQCGTVFQFRPPSAPPRPPAKRPPPPPKPSAPHPPPAAEPVPLAIPVAMPVELPSTTPNPDLRPPSDFGLPRRYRRTAQPGRGKRRLGLALIGVLVLALTGAGFWLYRTGQLDWLATAPPRAEVAGAAYTDPRFNFSFRLTARGWEYDDRVRLDLKAPLGLRRSQPNAWMALLVSKHDDHTPAAAELLDAGVRRLRDYFGNLEWEPRPDEQLSDHQAQRIVFLAERNGVPLTGECYMVGHQGIGYWFTTWAPSANLDVVAGEWEQLRRGFAILADREGWVEKKPKPFKVAGKQAAYTLTVPEGLWAEEAKPTDYDARADVALLGRDPTDAAAGDRTATALVLILPPQEELAQATAAARAHVEARQKDLYPMTTVKELADRGAVDGKRPPDEIGNVRGRLLRLHVVNGDNRERLIWLAVVPRPGQVVAIQLECDWQRRVFWEVNFRHLLRDALFRVK